MPGVIAMRFGCILFENCVWCSYVHYEIIKVTYSSKKVYLQDALMRMLFMKTREYIKCLSALLATKYMPH